MKRIYATVLLLLAAVLVITGCSGSDSPEEATPVTLQMAWTHEYFAAGLYAAEENGHYAENGLDMTLVEGGFGEGGYIEPIDVVVAGTYDFGLSDANALVRARAAGKPVVAIATIMQRSPSAIISLEADGIERPQDLPDHTVQVADGGARNLYNAMLQAQGIDEASIDTQPRTDFGVGPLLNGEADAIVGWIINEGVQVREAGETPNFIMLSDYGFDAYNLVIFTTETTIEEKPELVESVLRAIIAGYEDAIADPNQAADYIVENNPELDREGQLQRLQAMIPLINIPGQNLGVMDEQIWIDTQTIMLEAGSLDNGIDPQSVFTTSFLDKIYE